jgi:uncharacterized protein (DUF2267 family)
MTTGLMFLPFSLTMIVAAVAVSRLVQRVDPGKLSAVGATIATAVSAGQMQDVRGQLPQDLRDILWAPMAISI